MFSKLGKTQRDKALSEVAEHTVTHIVALSYDAEIREEGQRSTWLLLIEGKFELCFGEPGSVGIPICVAFPVYIAVTDIYLNTSNCKSLNSCWLPQRLIKNISHCSR